MCIIGLLVLLLACIVFSRSAFAVLAGIIMIILGCVWTLQALDQHEHTESFLKQHSAHGQSVVPLSAQVKSLYKVDEKNKIYRASLMSITGQENVEEDIDILVHIPKNLTLNSDDRITITEKLRFPRDTSETFSYRYYMHLQ